MDPQRNSQASRYRLKAASQTGYKSSVHKYTKLEKQTNIKGVTRMNRDCSPNPFNKCLDKRCIFKQSALLFLLMQHAREVKTVCSESDTSDAGSGPL